MTVFFSDIRSFTTLSETMTPAQTFAFINSYLQRAGPLIRKHFGLIDKYIGDAIMALFPRHPENAVAAAVDLQAEITIYNEHRARVGYAPIKIGIGLHTGILMLGTIGEEARMETTVISDAVDLASRMEGMTKFFSTTLLVTQSTYERLPPGKYVGRDLGTYVAHGMSRGTIVYEILDGQDAAVRRAKEFTLDRFNRAIGHYRAGDFIAAIAGFAAIVTEFPSDGPARYFIERSAMHAASKEPWSGIERLEAKWVGAKRGALSIRLPLSTCDADHPIGAQQGDELF